MCSWLREYLHPRKCSNEILPGVDLQILFLREYRSGVLFPSSFAEFSSVNIVGPLLVLLVSQELDLATSLSFLAP